MYFFYFFCASRVSCPPLMRCRAHPRPAPRPNSVCLLSFFPCPSSVCVASSSDNLTKATMINKLFCLCQKPTAYPHSFVFISALLSLPALLVLCSCINKLVFNFIKLSCSGYLWPESFEAFTGDHSHDSR